LAANESGINEFNVYPNPTQGNLTINIISEMDQTLNLMLTDLSGRVVGEDLIQASSGGSRTIMDLSDLDAGVYFVRVLKTNGEGLFTEKISKY